VGDREGYGWVDHEGLRDAIEADVTAAVTRLANLATAVGDADLAGWAARQGLLANPISAALTDAALAAVATDPERLAEQWRSTRRRYTANRIPVPDQLTRRYPPPTGTDN